MRLGNPALAAKNAADAAVRDAALRETLATMVGLASRTIAQRLTELGIASPRGGPWSQKTVLRMMACLGLQEVAARKGIGGRGPSARSREHHPRTKFGSGGTYL